MAKPAPNVDPRAIAPLWAPVQPYDWGSREFIARLQGRAVPSEGPEAELWIGDHPRAPSRLQHSGGHSLRDHIAAHPIETLGQASFDQFGARLPFLAKILAAARPLSLQVHPNMTQATAGFEAEERQRVPLTAPERTYSDPHRKIELMIAMEPFLALCGFRSSESLGAMLGGGELSTISHMRSEMEPSVSRAAGDLFFGLRGLDAAACKEVLSELQRFAEARADDLLEAYWVGKLLELYPGDIGAAAPLLLNLVEMKPGEGLFVRPGTLHSYLDGNGFEVMSSSDNVVRGGLTSKHVDQAALEAIAVRESTQPDVVSPVVEEAGVQRYALGERGVDEFDVRVLSLGGRTGPDSVQRHTDGKACVLICTEGSVEVHPAASSDSQPIRSNRAKLVVGAGAAAWIPGGTASIKLRAHEPSRVFEVRVP